MPEVVLFDASVHLGQFCQTSQAIRLGCKRSQIALSLDADGIGAGVWTDNENGRVDNAIWALPRALQDSFYPFMDRFFSITPIAQVPLEERDVKRALALMELGLALNFRSAYSCAVAIERAVCQLHTLYGDLLREPITAYMRAHHGIIVLRPEAQSEQAYRDDELEMAYQRALSDFQRAGVDVLGHIADSRLLESG